ncbi:hypothetical protein [Thermococcus sp. MAR1]|uniref:hypothetical protein n=1 Tax=Thermococcus sp. MAR1 TaxID=1638263 RepID=UPI00143C16DA|nr:hypothetical protein [Thermococcus sp. MAR1]NJE10305.1 hypothetical protein [Thermococcus sp. MAR1]
MRRRALLAMFVVLLLIGAYGAYVVSYPKYPEVNGCVNPFRVTTPVSRVQENWSKAHVFLKLATSRDFWKLAKPWDVDYSHVKIVKHTIEYNGEKITMLAMGIPLKDKKHVIALYEFSKPVQGVKVRGYLLELDNPVVKTVALTTNGQYKTANSCPHDCNSNNDCGEFSSCEPYCCSTDWGCAISCCLQAGHCKWLCRLGEEVCIACVVAECGWCTADYCCTEWGSLCQDWGNAP